MLLIGANDLKYKTTSRPCHLSPLCLLISFPLSRSPAQMMSSLITHNCLPSQHLFGLEHFEKPEKSKKTRIGRRHWGSGPTEGDTADIRPLAGPHPDNLPGSHFLIWQILSMLCDQIVNSEKGNFSIHLYLDPLLPIPLFIFRHTS